uniref:Protein ripply3 n=1 Tax=Sus scrofa TaxID=9823 RepID=A0A8D1GA87_PIG
MFPGGPAVKDLSFSLLWLRFEPWPKNFYLFIYLFILPFTARGTAHGNSQARAHIGATAAGLRHRPGNLMATLYLPISKRQEYLQSSGEKVLASFPVQATIHFYDDASESEEEQEEETQPSDLQDQEAEDSSGRKELSRSWGLLWACSSNRITFQSKYPM